MIYAEKLLVKMKTLLILAKRMLLAEIAKLTCHEYYWYSLAASPKTAKNMEFFHSKVYAAFQISNREVYLTQSTHLTTPPFLIPLLTKTFRSVYFQPVDIYPRKTRNFAPRKNFPLYSILLAFQVCRLYRRGRF